MDFSDLGKIFARTVVYGGASRRYTTTTIEPNEDPPTVPSEIGTDYATEYVEQENKRFLEVAKQRSTAVPDYCDSVSDLISQGTIPNLHEINASEMTQIYETFNFAYRPNPHLKINRVKDHIVSMVAANQVVVIQGPTGCGKTTQVPQYILNSCFDKKIPCNIIVTQPRRIAAISIAKRVSQERDWPVGTLVGYQVGMVNNTSKDTRLTYCTTGVLLQKLISTKHMMDYTHVILDEVHERDQEIDFLLLVVRKLLRSNSFAVRVVLMSATFNVDKFARYFSMPLSNKFEPAPVIDIEKSSGFNVHTFYLCQLQKLDYDPELSAETPGVSLTMMRLCVHLITIFDGIDIKEWQIKKLNEEEEFNRSVVLVFLPGIFEIEEMYNLLSSPENESYKWDIVVLHSSITNEEQQRIFIMPPEGYRRIILSTNIAESSITVPDVKYVIDFCLTKQLVTDPQTNFQCLELVWASKTNCKQRAGRTGRVMDGRVYRLVPKYFYEGVLPEESPPEMLRSPLESLVLKSKLLDMGPPKAILALSLDPPDLSNLERTVLLLKETGGLLDAIDTNSRHDGQLTDLGRVMAHLPVDIHISKLIVLGQVFSILRECIIIGASMSVKSMFSTPFQERLNAYNSKLNWADDSGSDCIAYLNVHKLWTTAKASGKITTNAQEKAWAKHHYIQIRVLREVDALVQDITRRLKGLGIFETIGPDKVVWKQGERAFVVKMVIAGAFYPHYFVKRFQISEDSEKDSARQLGGCDPANTVYLRGWPVQQPGQLYIRQFQDLFKECLNTPMSHILVSFDGSSRVYLQFCENFQSDNKQKDAKVSRKLSMSVYRALKMRRYNVPLILRLLNQETAKKRAEELGLSGTNAMPFTKNTEGAKGVINRPPLSPELPSIDTSFVPLFITHIENPGCFWAQNDDESRHMNLARINLLIAEQIKNSSNYIGRRNMPIGSLVIAPYERQGNVIYRRATVTGHSFQGKYALTRVFYIDYGKTGSVKTTNLTTIDADNQLYLVPSLAYKCSLASLKPSILSNLQGEWSTDAHDKFKEQLRGAAKFYGEIYSVVQSVVTLRLIRVEGNNEKLDLNDWLIKNGFAVFEEENYVSRRNHNVRARHVDMTYDECQYYDLEQYEHSFTREEHPIGATDVLYSKEVKLQGPYSPLEMELVNLVAAGRNKKVYIQSESVNSILLDADPTDHHERLVVAGSVGQNMTGTNLNLRNTTLMPNIHGLPSLMALTFAPTMELRKNVRGDHFIGALCGLGYDPETNASLFPEHDMYIAFDVEISIDDLQDINRLRYWMNMAIRIGTPERCDNTEIAICQKKVKGIVFEMIKKRRESQNPETPVFSMRWNKYDSSQLLQPMPKVLLSSNIFKLHSALALKEKTPGYREMSDHLEDLRNIAHGYLNKDKLDIECKLCSKILVDVSQLRIHLTSLEHRNKEDEADLAVY